MGNNFRKDLINNFGLSKEVAVEKLNTTLQRDRVVRSDASQVERSTNGGNKIKPNK